MKTIHFFAFVLIGTLTSCIQPDPTMRTISPDVLKDKIASSIHHESVGLQELRAKRGVRDDRLGRRQVGRLDPGLDGHVPVNGQIRRRDRA